MGKTEIKGKEEPHHGKQKQHHNGIVGHPAQQLFPFHNESAEADKKIGGKDCLYDGKCGDVNVHKSFILSPFVIALHGFPKIKIILIIKFI